MKQFIRISDGQKLRFINVERMSEVRVENKMVIGDEGQGSRIFLRLYFEGHREEDAIEVSGEQARLLLSYMENIAGHLQAEEEGDAVKLL
jgi:hypothetical protein